MHSCTTCNFSSKLKTNLTRHLNTSKHKEAEIKRLEAEEEAEIKKNDPMEKIYALVTNQAETSVKLTKLEESMDRLEELIQLLVNSNKNKKK